MPSPLGHALGGLAAGWLVSSTSHHKRNYGDAAWFALAGMAADLDLLAGIHSGPTHSAGATIIVGLFTYLISRRWRFAVALTAAYASHVLLDWLGSDAAPPIGVMALWPFSTQHYESNRHLFYAISRRYWQSDFWDLNIRAVVREILVLVPVTVMVGYIVRLRSTDLQEIKRSEG